MRYKTHTHSMQFHKHVLWRTNVTEVRLWHLFSPVMKSEIQFLFS